MPLWLNLSAREQLKSINLLLPGQHTARRTHILVQWVVAKICMHSNSDKIVFVLVKLRWKTNMLTAAAVSGTETGSEGSY